MNKPNFTKMLKTAQHFVTKHSPELLTGAGIFLGGTTVVLAVKATPKAMQLLEEEKNRQNELLIEAEETPIETLKPVDMVKVAWKPYVPAAVTGVVAVGCILGASTVHARRSAALYSAYKLSETALTEYKEKVIETIGEKKEKKVREEIAKDKIEKNPVTKTEIFMTGKGESLFYDPLSDRYFESDMETIRKAVNDLNYRMGYGTEMYVSLSDLYDMLDLKHTRLSDDLGWNIADGLIEPDFSTQMTDDGRPCIVLDYLRVPKYGFHTTY